MVKHKVSGDDVCIGHATGKYAGTVDEHRNVNQCIRRTKLERR